LNARVLFDGARDFLCEHFTIHCERVTTRDPRLLRQAQQQGIQAPQFFFQKPGRGVFRFAL